MFSSDDSSQHCYHQWATSHTLSKFEQPPTELSVSLEGSPEFFIPVFPSSADEDVAGREEKPRSDMNHQHQGAAPGSVMKYPAGQQGLI